MGQIIIKNITVKFGDTPILDNISLTVNRGQIIGIVGENGSGKTTLLKTIFGIIKPKEGTIIIEKDSGPFESNRDIMYLPQEEKIFSNLTVEENLKMNIFYLNNKKELNMKIAKALIYFPILKSRLKNKAGYLSGGEQQMLALSRIIIIKPKIVLLDEPTLGLSEKLIAEIFQRIKEINQQYQTTVLIAEHNVEALKVISDHILTIDNNKIKTIT
ncbi:MAG: ATP-binding cassette domain-containing protein [Candidatus Magasanikbacteria bacterium]